MKEIDFYPEICEKFSAYLLPYLSETTKIQYSYNKSLPQMIQEIENKFSFKSKKQDYIPKLKLDILFGFKMPNKNEIVYLLLEVKYLNQLGLSEYSQLAGYLQVAQDIKTGILFLVTKPKTNNALSNDFNEIIRTHNLPMKWKMLIEKQSTEQEKSFKTGISYYVPNNGIEWIDTTDINGISSFEELANEIEK